MKNIEINKADLVASFQSSVVESLVTRAMMAVKEMNTDKIAIAGGVASNTAFRDAMLKVCKENNVKFYRPSAIYCTDNAAMIGAAAYYDYINGKRSGLDLNAVPNLKLGERI